MEIPDNPPENLAERRAMPFLGNAFNAEVRELDKK